MKSRFDLVVVIGWGKTAGDVLRSAAQRQGKYGYRTLCIEYEVHGISKMRALCEETGADYARITDKQAVAETLEAIAAPALVISAGNTFLFPKRIIEKPNLEIINFHSALLPKFPGRNTQSWAIYEGEKVTGATWHYMQAAVDTGAIIAQREVPIPADVKAYELTRDIMKEASAAFEDFYEELLVRHIDGRPQRLEEGGRKMYYSWEVPGGGVCSASDPAEDIYRMLRAMDYGRSDIFPPARIRLPDGHEAEVTRYKKAPAEHLDGRQTVLDRENNRLYLAMGGGYELAIKFNLDTKGETEHGTENT